MKKILNQLFIWLDQMIRTDGTVSSKIVAGFLIILVGIFAMFFKYPLEVWATMMGFGTGLLLGTIPENLKK